MLSALLTLALLLAWKAYADCDCGYTVNTTDSESYVVFTDLFETDFLHVRDVTFNTTYSTGWEPQNYSMSSALSDGPYGMAKQSTNLIPNYIQNITNWAGEGITGEIDPGLQLWVRSETVGDKVSTAEIVSQRDDILYGSFRIGMKTTGVNGTCAAFFFYRNDSQEVDLEILSAEQHLSTSDFPVHLVVQNTSTAPPENDTTSNQLIYQLPWPPGGEHSDYNEYRFDWMPGRIDCYVNSWFMWSTVENIPSTPGRLHISHWSNGNPFWTRGPPVSDAVLTVSYVKAYFNSTNSTRIENYEERCGASNPDALQETCTIPNQDASPDPAGPYDNRTGHTYFFSFDYNKTEGGQILFVNPLDSGGSRLATMVMPSVGTVLVMVACGLAMQWG